MKIRNWLGNGKIRRQRDRDGLFLSLKLYWLGENKKEVGKKTEISVGGDDLSNFVNKIKYPTSQWTKILTLFRLPLEI